MKFLTVAAKQLIGATIVTWGAFVAGVDLPRAVGIAICALGMSILLERHRA